MSYVAQSNGYTKITELTPNEIYYVTKFIWKLWKVLLNYDYSNIFIVNGDSKEF